MNFLQSSEETHFFGIEFHEYDNVALRIFLNLFSTFTLTTLSKDAHLNICLPSRIFSRTEIRITMSKNIIYRV